MAQAERQGSLSCGPPWSEAPELFTQRIGSEAADAIAAALTKASATCNATA